jgi:hypothetical protein
MTEPAKIRTMWDAYHLRFDGMQPALSPGENSVRCRAFFRPVQGVLSSVTVEVVKA